MKGIWEDEGTVGISRNIDVLVPNLGKKISYDDSLKFINVHGREYKFIIDPCRVNGSVNDSITWVKSWLENNSPLT